MGNNPTAPQGVVHLSPEFINRVNNYSTFSRSYPRQHHFKNDLSLAEGNAQPIPTQLGGNPPQQGSYPPQHLFKNGLSLAQAYAQPIPPQQSYPQPEGHPPQQTITQQVPVSTSMTPAPILPFPIQDVQPDHPTVPPPNSFSNFAPPGTNMPNWQGTQGNVNMPQQYNLQDIPLFPTGTSIPNWQGTAGTVNVPQQEAQGIPDDSSTLYRYNPSYDSSADSEESFDTDRSDWQYNQEDMYWPHWQDKRENFNTNSEDQGDVESIDTS